MEPIDQEVSIGIKTNASLEVEFGYRESTVDFNHLSN